MQTYKFPLARKCSAFTLVEVLISTTIAAMMFAGLSAVSILTIKRSVRTGSSEYSEQQCYRMVTEIKAAMRSAQSATITDGGEVSNIGNVLTVGLAPDGEIPGGTIRFVATPSTPEGTYALSCERTSPSGTQVYEYATSAIPLYPDGKMFRLADYGFLEFAWALRVFRSPTSAYVLADIPFQGVAAAGLLNAGGGVVSSDTVNLTLVSGTGGTAIISGFPSVSTQAFRRGDTAVIVAVADDNYQFAGWTGGVSTSASSVSVLMDRDRTVSANWAWALPALVVKNESISVAEGASAPFSICLAGPPAGEMVVSVAKLFGGDPGLSVPADTTFVFDASNWNVYQLASISAAEDNTEGVNGTAEFLVSSPGAANVIGTANEVDGDRSLTIAADNGSVFASQAPNGTNFYDAGTVLTLTANPDPGYMFTGWTGDLSGAQPSQKSLTIDTNKSVTATFALVPVEIVLSSDTAAVPEGGSAAFTVALTSPPASPLTVVCEKLSGDDDITVSNSLPFTAANWNIPQVVSIAAAEDDMDQAVGFASIRVSAPGLTEKTLTATEVDDDYALAVNASGGTITRDKEPNIAGYYDAGTVVVLTGLPDSTHSLPAAWSTNLSGSTAIITMDGDKTISATFAVGIVLSAESISIPAGESMAVLVHLAAQPQADIVVSSAKASGDANISIVSGDTLTFTPADYDTDQQLTVAAGSLPGSAVITVLSSEGASKDIAVIVGP